MVITMYPGPIGGQIHSNFHGYFILASTFFNSITKWFPISAFYQCCQWITKLSPIRRKLRRLLKAAEVAETPEEVKVISYSNKSGITQAWKFSVCNCVDFMIPISLWKFALGSRPCSVNSTKEENENKDNAQNISTLSNISHTKCIGYTPTSLDKIRLALITILQGGLSARGLA